MDLYESDDLRVFLVSLFGNQANNWPMTESIFDLTFELVSESGDCSGAMDLVPRPIPFGKQPFKWMSKELRGAFLRDLKENKEQYVICLKAAAYRMAGQFRLASQGVL